jgi:hypothetical protein
MLQFLATMASAMMPPVLPDFSEDTLQACADLPGTHDEIEEGLNWNTVAYLLLYRSQYFQFNDTSHTASNRILARYSFMWRVNCVDQAVESILEICHVYTMKPNKI